MLAILNDLSLLQVVCVLAGFSLLIFVHELGHFLAARLVGVRVEKFMIGIDAWGWGLRKKIGDTEYGLGLLPFGGYVKLAGQSDMPGEDTATGASDELASKSPAARMLVFVSGVIMNFILGFLILLGLAIHGKPLIPTVIGVVSEGSPAAKAGLQPLDRILAIDGNPIRWWENDLLQTVAFSEGQPMEFLVRRGEGDTATTFRTSVTPQQSTLRGKLHMIQVMPLASNRTRGVPQVGAEFPLLREVVASIGARVLDGDEILAVDGHPIAYQHELEAYLEARPGSEVTLTLRRGVEERQETIRVPALDARYEIGLTYGVALNSIGFVRNKDDGQKTPAEKAGFNPGDMIHSVNGQPLGRDATREMTRLIRTGALGDVTLSVVRNNQAFDTTLRTCVRDDIPGFTGGVHEPDTLLGITLVPGAAHAVRHVIPGGPADGVLESGDTITAVNGEELAAGEDLAVRIASRALRPITIGYLRDNTDLTADVTPVFHPRLRVPVIGIFHQDMPSVFRVAEGSVAERLGMMRGDTDIIFELSADLEKTRISWRSPNTPGRRDATIDTPEAVRTAPTAAGIRGQSGLDFDFYTELDRAPTFGAALGAAAGQSVDMGLSVYKMLNRLVSGRINITAVGGPILIFQVIYKKAGDGLTRLLDLLALISINLGVLNLLPLPVLDGGHCLFLLIEMIKGSPPSVRIREYAQYAGFVLIVGFFMVVMGIDFYYVILRGGGG